MAEQQSTHIVSQSNTTEPQVNNIAKVYVDASFDYLTNSIGTGMVLVSIASDYEGIKGSYADGIIDPEAGECMSVLEALSWIKAQNIEEIHLIADAETVVNSIKSASSQVRWENNNLISSIRTLVSSFKICKVSHVKRNLNNLADCISKKVRREKLLVEEYVDYSPWILSVLRRHSMPDFH